MQAMTTEARQAPGGRRLAQSPCFLFGAKGASAGKGIKQRQPFRCNNSKTSKTAGRRSSWSPSRRHRQGLWQARTNFTQDKCSRCSPSKWPIVGALPAQYLGRGPGPLPINRTRHPQGRGNWIYKILTKKPVERATELPQQFIALAKNRPSRGYSPLCCSSSAQEAIHHTTHWSRVLHHNGGPNQYKSCVFVLLVLRVRL